MRAGIVRGAQKGRGPTRKRGEFAEDNRQMVKTRKGRGRIDLAKAVDKAISAIAEKLGSDAGKGTAGDLIRLLQLRAELGTAQPKAVTARWVEQWESTPTDR